MTARRKREPAIRPHKASGGFLIRIGGQVRYLGRERNEANRRARALLAEYALRGDPASTRPITVSGLGAAYLRQAERLYVDPDGRPKSELLHVRGALRAAMDLYGPLPAAAFSPLKLRAVRQQIVASGMTRKGVNAQVGRLRRVFRWAVAEELIPASVYEALRCLEPLRAGRCEAPEGKPRLPVNEADYQATLPHLSPTVRAIVELLFTTGMRPDEVLRMRVEDIDTTGEVWSYRLARHKTAAHVGRRVVYLGPRTQQILAPLVQGQEAGGYLFKPTAAVAQQRQQRRAARKTPLYPSHVRHQKRKRSCNPSRPPGEKYTARSLHRAVTRACEKAGVAPWTPYQLRHSAATRLRRELGIEAAKIVLGHTSLALTEIYAERDERAAIEIAKRLG